MFFVLTENGTVLVHSLPTMASPEKFQFLGTDLVSCDSVKIHLLVLATCG